MPGSAQIDDADDARTPKRPGRGRLDFDDADVVVLRPDLPAAGRWAEAGVGELAHEPVAGYQAVGVGDGDPDRRRLGRRAA